MHLATERALCLAEMPHRGQKYRDPLLARPHVLGFLRDLGHPHCVVRSIETVKDRCVRIQLIPEHDHERTHALRRAHAGVSKSSCSEVFATPPRSRLNSAKAASRAAAWFTIGPG